MGTKEIVKTTRKNHKISQHKMAELIRKKWPDSYSDQSGVSRAEQGGNERVLLLMIQYFIEELNYEASYFYPNYTDEKLKQLENDIQSIKSDLNEIKTLLTNFLKI